MFVRFFTFFLLMITFLCGPHLFAEEWGCKIDNTGPVTAGEITKMLEDCSGENGIKPSNWTYTKKDENGNEEEHVVENVSGFKQYILKIAGTAISFAGLFAVGAIVWAGIQYTTAYGNDEKLSTAKKTGTYAAIGLFLALIAYPLVNLVVNFIYGIMSS